ncbi:MAG: hypothetical protein JKX91_06385 [Rhizobiaceae bacterium]|nr:hypothetical protein [Rhizobiaceae bacterium]
MAFYDEMTMIAAQETEFARLKNDLRMFGAQGDLGMAALGQQSPRAGLFNGFNQGIAAGAALRDGTGKEVSHPKSFIEELQAETDEWLKEVI